MTSVLCGPFFGLFAKKLIVNKNWCQHNLLSPLAVVRPKRVIIGLMTNYPLAAALRSTRLRNNFIFGRFAIFRFIGEF